MRSRGFTLVELTIALAIVMLLVGVSIPVLDNVTRAELRAAASKTTGMVKATYDLAVLSGKPARLVFDFKQNSVTAEVASDRITIADKDSAKDAKSSAPKEDEEDEKATAKGRGLAALAKLAGKEAGSVARGKRAASWSRAPGTVAFELPSSVKISEVMAEHMSDAQREGKATIHFFPMGYCEHALIHFEDSSQRVFAVEIEPLTGRTRISDQRVEYKEPK